MASIAREELARPDDCAAWCAIYFAQEPVGNNFLD